MDKEKWQELRCYIRWHENDRTIAHIKKKFGVTSQDVRDAYDTLFYKNKGGLLPKKMFRKPHKEKGYKPVREEMSIQDKNVKEHYDNCILSDFQNGMNERELQCRWGTAGDELKKILSQNEANDLSKFTAVEKVLALTTTEDWISTNDFHERTGIKRTTCSAVLGSLRQLGYMESQRDGKNMKWRLRNASME